MLTVFKNTFNNTINFLKYFSYCIKCNTMQAVSNKKSFIIQTLFMFLNNFVWLAFWFIIFYNSEGGNINGVTINDIIYLWSAPTLSFGLCYFLFGGVEDISYKVANKEIDNELTKPKHSLISLITSSAKLSAVGDIIYGLVLGIFATDFNPIKYLWLIVVSIIAAIGFLGINILVQSFAFWFGDISKSARTYTMNLLITLTIYPEGMFKGIIKVLMYTVIPAMYVAHTPIAIIQTFNLKLLLLEIVAVTTLITLGVITYNKGLKRYGR